MTSFITAYSRFGTLPDRRGPFSDLPFFPFIVYSTYPRFVSLCVAFYRGADCVVFVYDLNLESSVKNLIKWKAEFEAQCEESVPIVVSVSLTLLFFT